MEEKTFLEILREYFASKSDNEILVGDKRNIVIPMEWIFTEKIDREVIQRAMVQVLKQHRKDYVENYVDSKMGRARKRNVKPSDVQQAKEDEVRRQANTKIKNISLNITRDGLKMVANGIDGWTKAMISEKPQQDGKILEISEEEFCSKILGVLKSDSILGILDTFQLTEREKEYFQSMFANASNEPMDEFTLDGIKKSMSKAAQNLTEYYDYLSREKMESRVHSITINQRQGVKTKKNVPSEPTETTARRCPIYPFVEREKLLREMKPSHVINVHGYDEDGQVIPNVYTTFVYDNPRGNKGKLLVAEPLEGTHSTRILFMADEEFENFEVEQGVDKYEAISKKYLEMSADEFVREKNAKTVYHDDIDVYGEKMRYIISGIALSEKQQRAKVYYNKILNKIYGKRKITADIIGVMGAKALGDEVNVAESIIDGLKAKDKNQVAKGEEND